jgi:hypothetical protein
MSRLRIGYASGAKDEGAKCNPIRTQPFDEPFLADMLLTDRVKSTKEVLDRTSFLGDRLKIEEKPRRLVIGRSVAPLDFGLDLAPDAFTPPCYRQ